MSMRLFPLVFLSLLSASLLPSRELFADRIAAVTFTPDQLTHNTCEQLRILPNDAESVLFEEGTESSDPECQSDSDGEGDDQDPDGDDGFNLPCGSINDELVDGSGPFVDFGGGGLTPEACLSGDCDEGSRPIPEGCEHIDVWPFVFCPHPMGSRDRGSTRMRPGSFESCSPQGDIRPSGDVDGGGGEDDGESWQKTIWILTSNPGVALLEHNGELVEAFPTTVTDTSHFVGRVNVRGVGIGSGTVEAREGSVSGPLLGGLSVKVGGTVIVEYNQLPTYLIQPSSPIGEAGADHAESSNFLGGSEVLSGRRNARSPLSDELISVINAAKGYQGERSIFRVTLLDSEGDPKPNKAVAILSHNGLLHAVLSDGTTGNTNEDGVIDSQIYASIPSERAYLTRTDSYQEDKLTVLVGRGIGTYLDGTDDLLEQDLETLSVYNNGNLTFTGHSVRFDWDFENAADLIDRNFAARVSLNFSPLNDAHVSVLTDKIERDIYSLPDEFSLEGVDFSLFIPTGVDDLFAESDAPLISVIDERMPYPLEQEEIQALFTGDSFRSIVVDDLSFRDLYPDIGIINFSFEDIDSDWPGKGENPRIVTVGAIAAEMALCFVPGYDLVDTVKYGFWKPIFEDDTDPWNYAVATASLAGLVADAGYLAGGIGGAISNAITSIFKVVFKWVPIKFVISALRRIGGDLVGGLKFLFQYAQKIPRPIGMGLFEWAVESATKLINQWNKILHSPIGFRSRDFADTLRVIGTKSPRTLSDRAALGTARLVREGSEDIVGRAFDEFCDAFSHLRSGGFCLGTVELWLELVDDFASVHALEKMAPQAKWGMATTIEALTPLDAEEYLRRLLEGESSRGSLEKIFTNFGDIYDFSGADSLVDGFDDLVRFTCVNSGNGLPQFYGVVFEGTVAANLAKGTIDLPLGIVPPGELERVAVDALDEVQVTDLFTTNWAVQVKATTSSVVTTETFGNRTYRTAEAYLGAFRSHAVANGRVPVVALNRPPSSELEVLLGSLGIQWVRVSEGFPGGGL